MKVSQVDCIAVEKRTYPSKHYVYILSVSWDTGLKHPIYRTYAAFFDFLACLKEEVKGRRGVTLPELPVLKWFEKGRLGGLTSTAAAERRKKYINDFCREVLQMPPDLVRGPTVASFFETWNSDFTQHDSSQQSLGDNVRLPLDFLRKLSQQEPEFSELGRSRSFGEPEGQRLFPFKRHTHGLGYHGEEGADIMGNISDCLGNEKKASTSSESGPHQLRKQGSIESFDRSDVQYRVISDFKKRKPGEVSLVEGAIVDVLETDLSGWWFIHIEETQKQGWAPGAYLEPAQSGGKDEHPNQHSESTSNTHSVPTGAPVAGSFHTTVAYKGQRKDELSYSQGQEVQVLEPRMDGWWKVRCNDQVGYIPATHLEQRQDTSGSKNQKGLQNLLGGGLYHQQTIYKKKSPPPRRTTTIRKKSLEVLVEPSPVTAPTEGNMSDNLIRDNGRRKQVKKKPQVPQYSEIVFDDDENGDVKKPIIKGDDPTGYADIEIGKVGELLPDSDSEEETTPDPDYPVLPKAEPRHNYVNVNIPAQTHPYVNVTIPPKLQPKRKEEDLYECIEDYHPHTAHRQGLPLNKGDIVKVEAEQSDQYLCLKCAKNKDSKPMEGWVPKNCLRKAQAGVSGQTKHSVPIVQVEPERKEKPPPLNLHDAKASDSGGPTVLPPMPCLTSPTLPSHVSKPLGSPTSMSTKIRALYDFTAPQASKKMVQVFSFKKNAEAKLMSKSMSGWWCVRMEGTVGWVPGDYWETVEEAPPPLPPPAPSSRLASSSSLDQDSPLYSPVIHKTHESEPWFQGRMGRKDCESIMKACSKDGAFMVREGTHLSESFTLSVHFRGKVRHFAVKRTPEGKYNFGKYDFKTLIKVVKYYQGHTLFYEEENSVSLTDPVAVVTKM